MAATDNLDVERQHFLPDTNLNACEKTETKPKFPQYAAIEKRIETYKTWPSYIPVKKEELAESGLFSTGEGDKVRCFYCGGGLEAWRAGDNPLDEHASVYPTCQYLKERDVDSALHRETPDQGGLRAETNVQQEASQDEVSRTTSLQSEVTKLKAQIDVKNQEIAVLTEKLEQAKRDKQDRDLDVAFYQDELRKKQNIISRLIAYQNCLASVRAVDGSVPSNSTNRDAIDACLEYFTKMQVEKAIDKYLHENDGRTDFKAENLVTIIQGDEFDLLCELCLDPAATVTFLPCEHMARCIRCAEEVFKCPVCRYPVFNYFPKN